MVLLLTTLWARPPEPLSTFEDLGSSNREVVQRAARRLKRRWRNGYGPMVLEVARFRPIGHRVRLTALLADVADQPALRGDLDASWRWVWSRPYTPHPEYGRFKTDVYAHIDPAFSSYFLDLKNAKIRPDEIRWGGVKRDGIPPLDHPRTVSAEAASSWLDDDDIVFGVTIDGEARAYPKRILAWHELVRDRLGGRPITGVYCTLCGAMIVYDPVVGATNHELGTSGFLYRSNKLMVDQATDSLWSTLTGEPVLGPLVDAGIQLEVHPSVVTTWGAWRAIHPTSTVVSRNTGHQRDYGEGVAYRDYFNTDDLMFTVPEPSSTMLNKQPVLALRFGDQPAVVDLRALPEVANLTLNEQDFVVLRDSGGGHRVYDRTGLTFEPFGSGVRDNKGQTWSLAEHALVRSDGATRARLPAHTAFWFGWHAAHPDTTILSHTKSGPSKVSPADNRSD